MIIGMRVADAKPLESYCSACDTWSPDDDWEDRIEFDGDDNVTIDSVECPNCGHWHPPHDPPMREADA